MNSGSPFTDFLGIEVLEEKDGVGRARLPYHTKYGNRNGTVHGGAIATLIDIALGRATWSLLDPDQQTATVEMKINFLSPAAGDLECTGRVIRHGRLLSVAEAEVVDLESGKVVAKALSTFVVQSRRA